MNHSDSRIDDKSKNFVYPEIPYDYGEECAGLWGAKWKDVLLLHRPDHHLWFWDIGVNMQGDVAACVHVEFAPKLETEAYDEGFAGVWERQKMGLWTGAWVGYETWIRSIHEQEKKGQRIVYIPRHPELSFTGGTIWTFNRSGEKRSEMAVISWRYNNGVQIDENGNLYFTHSMSRNIEGKTFLEGRAGHFGAEGKNPGRDSLCTFTGTYIKTRGTNVRFLLKNSIITVDEFPPRPPDLKYETDVWVESAEWFYAGASPMVTGGCNCPQFRAHLDW